MKRVAEYSCPFVGVCLLAAGYAWNEIAFAIFGALFLVAWLLIGRSDRRERGS